MKATRAASSGSVNPDQFAAAHILQNLGNYLAVSYLSTSTQKSVCDVQNLKNPFPFRLYST
ncbi:hypothetical protein AOP6_0224 [Desulfuromonas sp. AOP6]|nr:hypothetical protein AOP6_0224 [Desulfuromonas sp. AOP6]